MAIAFLIKCFSFFPAAVEQYYANGVYPYIGSTQRVLFGWIPFSIGDVFYAAITIYLLYKAFIFCRAAWRKQVSKGQVIIAFEKTLAFILSVYVLFNALWGLNYDRPPMSRKLEIKLAKYSISDLKNVMRALVSKLNALDSTAVLYRADLRIKKRLFTETVKAYRDVDSLLPFLYLRRPSIKPSIYSYAGNYLGFSGYYNPFSGEAQVNTTIPAFAQPFVSCHEIGHQLGFAKEDEANFAGFLAARLSANPAFRYSVYFDMYAYALNELYHRDSSSARELHLQLKPQVKKDYADIQAFFSRHENPLEPVIRDLYGQYLKANEQPGGLRSYNQVVAMLIAYERKYGRL
jgi:hypothetical protein